MHCQHSFPTRITTAADGIILHAKEHVPHLVSEHVRILARPYNRTQRLMRVSLVHSCTGLGSIRTYCYSVAQLTIWDQSCGALSTSVTGNRIDGQCYLPNGERPWDTGFLSRSRLLVFGPHLISRRGNLSTAFNEIGDAFERDGGRLSGSLTLFPKGQKSRMEFLRRED